MTEINPAEVRSFLEGYLSRKLEAQGHDIPSDLPDDYDLLLSGTIDSLGLVELMVAMRDHFGQEIDFEDLDPEQMTVVEPLCRFVSEQLKR